MNWDNLYSVFAASSGLWMVVTLLMTGFAAWEMDEGPRRWLLGGGVWLVQISLFVGLLISAANS